MTLKEFCTEIHHEGFKRTATVGGWDDLEWSCTYVHPSISHVVRHASHKDGVTVFTTDSFDRYVAAAKAAMGMK